MTSFTNNVEKTMPIKMPTHNPVKKKIISFLSPKAYLKTIYEVPPHTPFFKYNLWRPIAIRSYL